MVKQRLKQIETALNRGRITRAEYEKIMTERLAMPGIKILRGMEDDFENPVTEEEHRIHDLIKKFRSERTKQLEAELFKQKKRLADADRALYSEITKAAQESQRIAGNKIEALLDQIGDFKRTQPKTKDSRIFPMNYAPVVTLENGQLIVRPMRYHCRPARAPEAYDRKYPGLYNARRDNLEKFWREQWGHSHGIVVMTGFYENVAKHDFENRPLRDGEAEKNVVLNFNPQPPVDMLVACLWSKWSAPRQFDLYSFAAITDEPPAEVAAAGHDRCIIPIKSENVMRWLDPEAQNPADLYGILDDRERPFFEHRIAA